MRARVEKVDILGWNKSNNVCVNKPFNPLNHFGIFACNHMSYLYLRGLIKEKKKERKIFFFVHGDLPSAVSATKR